MRGELEAKQNCNILTPTLMAIAAFLSSSPGLLNRRHGGPASMRHGPHSSFFAPTGTAQLSAGSLYRILAPTAWTSCRRCYIIIWHPLFFLRASQFCTQFNPSTVKVISWYSSTGCTSYLHWCISYFDSLAGVNILQMNILTY